MIKISKSILRFFLSLILQTTLVTIVFIAAQESSGPYIKVANYQRQIRKANNTLNDFKFVAGNVNYRHPSSSDYLIQTDVIIEDRPYQERLMLLMMMKTIS